MVVRAEPQGLDRQAGVGLEPGTAPGETPERGWDHSGLQGADVLPRSEQEAELG